MWVMFENFEGSKMPSVVTRAFYFFALVALLSTQISLAQNTVEDELYDQREFMQTPEPEKDIGRLVPHPNDPENEDSSADDTKAATPIRPDENDVVVDNRRTEDDSGETKIYLPNADETISKSGANFYSHDVVDIEGKTVHLNQYRNKISLVVNVASECGFTDLHYKGLVRMHSILSSGGKFNVLAFPCNQFGAQEPGENKQILQFVKENYQVHFPVFSKIRVLDSDVPAAWQYLQEQSGKVPNWNFWKYLVDEDGNVVDAWGPWTSVEEIFDTVKAAVDRISKPSDPDISNIITDRQPKARTEL